MRFLVGLCCLTVCAGVKIKSESTKQNTDLFEYSEHDEYTLPKDIDDDKPPVFFTGDVMKALILNIVNKNHGRGKFKYSLQTQNGIELTQVGKLKDPKTFVISGSYSYTGADGKRYRVRYTADEYGYHPITELDLDLPDLDPTKLKMSPGLAFLASRLGSNGKVQLNGNGNVGQISSGEANKYALGAFHHRNQQNGDGSNDSNGFNGGVGGLHDGNQKYVDGSNGSNGVNGGVGNGFGTNNGHGQHGENEGYGFNGDNDNSNNPYSDPYSFKNEDGYFYGRPVTHLNSNAYLPPLP